MEVLQEKSLLLTGRVGVTGTLLATASWLMLLLIIVMSGGTDFTDLYLIGVGS